MRRIKLIELQNELDKKNIPQFCAKLKSRNGYDSVARKLRINPTEQRLIDAFKQEDSISDNTKV